MMRKIFLIKKFLDIVYGCLFSWLITAFVSIIFFQKDIYGFFIPCIIVLYVSSYVARDIAANTLVVFIVQLLPILAFIPFKIEKEYIFVFALINIKLFYDSFKYIKNNKKLKPDDEAPWPVFLLCFVFFLYGYFVRSEMLKNASYIILIMLIVTYLLGLYADRLGRYVDATKNVADLPLRNMIKTNSVIVGFIVAFLVLAIIVCNLYNWKHILDIIVNGIVSIINFFAAGILFIINFIENLFAGKLSSSSGEFMEETGLESSDYVEEGQYLFELFRLAFVIVVSIIILRYILRAVRRLLIRHNKMSDIVEETPVGRAVSVENEKRKNIFAALFSNEERARRIYRNRILSYRYDISLKENKTCLEIQKEIKRETGNDESMLTSLYADVRYGNEMADKNIVKKMSSLIAAKK